VVVQQAPGSSRRDFLKHSARFGLAVAGGSLLLPDLRWLPEILAAQEGATVAPGSLRDLIRTAPTARFWVSTASAAKPADCRACHDQGDLAAEHAHEEVVLRCQLCARNCLIPEGERGRCRARMNVGGELKSLVYGRIVSVHVDPIEKKPFYHFLPGSAAYSIATAGCPLSCRFCQNWEISQARPEDHAPRFVPAERTAGAAAGRRAPVIAFTYNEPTVFTEYLLDVAHHARQRGIRTALVSCGFMNEAPLAAMCKALDAIKIDLKGFSPEFYRNVCRAELQPVLRSIKQVARSGTHLELVNLVVPTLNDSEKMLTALSRWVVGEIGPDVPVHFTRFHPDYQLRHLPPTPVATLVRARDIAMQQGIRYAFVGNVPGHPGNHTYCHACGKVVIERRGFFVTGRHLRGGRCRFCDAGIKGVWNN
jgi:pyruvate formate lyase activating enzyme